VAGGEPVHQEAIRTLGSVLQAGGFFEVSLVSITTNAVPALANLAESKFKAAILGIGPDDTLPADQISALGHFVRREGDVVGLIHSANMLQVGGLVQLQVGESIPQAFKFQI